MQSSRKVQKMTLGLLCAGLLTMLPLAAHADLAQEISTAADHAKLSTQAPTLKVAQLHLHHTLNCLVGSKGHGYDAKAGDPCSGMGKGAILDEASAKPKRMLEHIAARVHSALRNHHFATVKKLAGEIEVELAKVK